MAVEIGVNKTTAGFMNARIQMALLQRDPLVQGIINTLTLKANADGSHV